MRLAAMRLFGSRRAIGSVKQRGEMTLIYANLAILAINLGVLALTIKLYTEILKDASQARRSTK